MYTHFEKPIIHTFRNLPPQQDSEHTMGTNIQTSCGSELVSRWDISYNLFYLPRFQEKDRLGGDHLKLKECTGRL